MYKALFKSCPNSKLNSNVSHREIPYRIYAIIPSILYCKCALNNEYRWKKTKMVQFFCPFWNFLKERKSTISYKVCRLFYKTYVEEMEYIEEFQMMQSLH